MKSVLTSQFPVSVLSGSFVILCVLCGESLIGVPRGTCKEHSPSDHLTSMLAFGYFNSAHFNMPNMTLIGRSLRVTSPYHVQYATPLTVIKGERLNVGRADDQFPGWRWCTARDGREGWVPIELLSHEGAESTILQDYSARELDVHTGEVVVVEDDRHGWLLVLNVNGERGWIPADRVHKP